MEHLLRQIECVVQLALGCASHVVDLRVKAFDVTGLRLRLHALSLDDVTHLLEQLPGLDLESIEAVFRLDCRVGTLGLICRDDVLWDPIVNIFFELF